LHNIGFPHLLHNRAKRSRAVRRSALDGVPARSALATDTVHEAEELDTAVPLWMGTKMEGG